MAAHRHSAASSPLVGCTSAAADDTRKEGPGTESLVFPHGEDDGGRRQSPERWLWRRGKGAWTGRSQSPHAFRAAS
jgi:hypothetical protein